VGPWDWLLLRPIAHRGLHGGPDDCPENSQEHLSWKASCADGGVDSARALLERVFLIRRSESSEFFRNLPEPAAAVQQHQ